MSVEKNTYELTYIVNAVISDDQIKDLIRRVTAYVSDSGGEIIEVEEWGSRRLAFPIHKKRNGYYVNMYFRATGTMIARMERALEIDDNILRYLTLKMDAKMIRHYEKRKAADPDAIGLIAEDRTRGPKDRNSSDTRRTGKKPFVAKKSDDATTPKAEKKKPEEKDTEQVEAKEPPDEKDEKPAGKDAEQVEAKEPPDEKDEKPAGKDAEPTETESSTNDSPDESSEEQSGTPGESESEAAEGEDRAEEKEKTDA